MSEMAGKQVNYGCLFCKAGCEQRVARELMENKPHLEAIAPVRLRYHRGKQTDEQDILFPGYVFIRTDMDCNLPLEIEHRYVYRVLCNAERDWRLYGADALIAEEMFRAGGVIGYSRVYYENRRIRIREGFLKDYEGSITRVNRRMRTAEVALTFCKREMRIWVGFEEIAGVDSGT